MMAAFELVGIIVNIETRLPAIFKQHSATIAWNARHWSESPGCAQLVVVFFHRSDSDLNPRVGRAQGLVRLRADSCKPALWLPMRVAGFGITH